MSLCFVLVLESVVAEVAYELLLRLMGPRRGRSAGLRGFRKVAVRT